MSKIGSFFVFCADESKTLVTVQAKHLSVPENVFEFFQKMVWLIREIWRVQILKKLLSQQRNNETLYLQGLISC